MPDYISMKSSGCLCCADAKDPSFDASIKVAEFEITITNDLIQVNLTAVLSKAK